MYLVVSVFWYCVGSFFFFFQAEDGIRDYKVTGVQTCALPISTARGSGARPGAGGGRGLAGGRGCREPEGRAFWAAAESRERLRSEEHTSELQSPCNLVCRLLLEKKKNRVWRAIGDRSQL